MSIERKQKFEDFVSWFNKHITGDEKGEGQIFLERFIQSFGNKGIKEIGASCEERIKKKSGTTGFADLVWKPRMVLELKKRGENLSKHYDQAFEYWISLVPNRPRYMVLCNFDEFWIYDLDTQISDPIHKLETKDLADDWGAFGFLFPKEEKPVFNNNNVEVTKQAAEIIGSMFFSLTQRKVDPLRAQRFVLQLVVALFAEDVNLIPKYTLYKILKEAISNPITQDEMTKLFKAMSTNDEKKKPKPYKDIAYFNGGLFNEVDPIELNFKELHLLYTASEEDWSKVRPSIFGSIFESSMDAKKRHAGGVHFTSELDIQKIVYPTIVKPLKDKIESAKNKKQLIPILEEIRTMKVLDPACGSGNFLYIAYRELVRLEMQAMEKMDKKFDSDQVRTSDITAKNFYGIDINGFGIELAKIALSIGRKLAADEFNLYDNILPFDNLDSSIVCKDALFTDWPITDVIIGNPPFLGSRKMRDNGFSDQYIEKLWTIYPKSSFPRSADFCCYWFRKAHDHNANFVGLVGSNSITQNESRKASLEYITEHGGKIHNAISSQPWSGDAAVHVSIVNWRKDNWDENPVLDGNEVQFINSSLKYEFDVSKATRLKRNKNICFQGVVPVGKFEIPEDIAQMWINKDSRNKEVIKIFFSGNELTEYPDYRGKKWIIDFNDFTIEKASAYKLPFEWVKDKVKPQRLKVRRKSHKEKWWQYGDKRPAMRKGVEKLDKYIAMPGHSKWYIPVFVPSDWLPYVNSSFAITSDDYYLLGILTSKLHRDWIEAQRSTLEDRTRYTNTTCFETFPFLWDIEEKKKNLIRKIMRELDEHRLELMKEKCYGITKLYNEFFEEKESKLRKFHNRLDELVVNDIYGWKFDPNKSFNKEVFELNKEITL